MKHKEFDLERVVVGLLLLMVVELGVLCYMAYRVESEGVTVEVVEGE